MPIRILSRRPFTVFVMIILLIPFLPSVGTVTVLSADPTDAWREQWNEPGAENRPLQIVHGWFGDRTTTEKLLYYRDDCGLGGLVVNVASDGYLQNEKQWDRLLDVVRSAHRVGLRIWIYDEDGYPSLMAGGRVLQGHPELESQALVYDASKEGDQAFSVRPAYEHTHAASKYATLRRYPNPLDPAATRRFLEVTHQEYKKRLGTLHDEVEAYFTDEPSLNAVNIGTIPEEVQKTLTVADPIDPNVPLLPMVAWSDALRAELEKDGKPFDRKSLFVGDTESDKEIRGRFWQTVARLNAEFYYRAIRTWCRENGTVSSGHTLHEENILGHVPLDGNKLSVLREMDIPGLDQLNSDPRVFAWGGWKAAGFPASAAYLNGTRRLFTEISDFAQKMGRDKKPTDLAHMQAAAAWQAAWGVTEFTLYYRIEDRDPATHRAYCDYVGRINALLRRAEPVPLVLLYYPITEMQREYRPTAEPLNLDKQSTRLREIIRSFDRLGEMLVRHHVPFVMVDDQALSDLRKRDPQKTWRLIVPRQVPVPASLIGTNLEPVHDSKEKPIGPMDLAPMTHEYLDSDSTWIAFGKFQREGQLIYLLVNADSKPYQGVFHAPQIRLTRIWDPATGSVKPLSGASETTLSLEPCQAVLLTGNSL